MRKWPLYGILVLLLMGFGNASAQLWQSVGGGFFYPSTYCMYADTVADLLYVGGRFNQAGDSTVCQIAAWDGSHWNKVGMSPTDTICAYDPSSTAHSIITRDGLIFAGGDFRYLNGTTANELLIQGNGHQWTASGHPNSMPVLEITNGLLFAMGFMTEVNGISVDFVARWDSANGWERFCDSLPTLPGSGWLATSEYYQGNYYFAGNFNPPNSPFKEIAYWDGTQWNPLGNGIPNDTWVNKLKVYKDRLLVGGEFYAANGFPSAYLAGWNGSQWYNPFPQVEYLEQVRDMQVIDGVLYILGGHRVWNGSSWQGPRQLAKYDGQQFCSFGGQDIFPRDIAGLNGHLYVTTTYTTHADPYHGIAEWLGGDSVDICISQPVRVSDPETAAAPITLHPNPATSHFTLALSAKAPCTLRIHNLTGQEVKEAFTYHAGEAVDIAHLPAGLYFVEVTLGRQKQVLKLVKQ